MNRAGSSRGPHCSRPSSPSAGTHCCFTELHGTIAVHEFRKSMANENYKLGMSLQTGRIIVNAGRRQPANEMNANHLDLRVAADDAVFRHYKIVKRQVHKNKKTKA